MVACKSDARACRGKAVIFLPLFVDLHVKRKVAEGVRFELTRPFGLPVFKTGAINRSATPPEKCDR